jgi:hypothetical protein
MPSDWQRQLALAVDFWRRRLTGEYEVDDFGFDPDLTENVLVPLLRPLYHTWFRTEVIGTHNLPGAGLFSWQRAGGLWAIDGAMTAMPCVTHPNPDISACSARTWCSRRPCSACPQDRGHARVQRRRPAPTQ